LSPPQCRPRPPDNRNRRVAKWHPGPPLGWRHLCIGQPSDRNAARGSPGCTGAAVAAPLGAPERVSAARLRPGWDQQRNRHSRSVARATPEGERAHGARCQTLPKCLQSPRRRIRRSRWDRRHPRQIPSPLATQRQARAGPAAPSGGVRIPSRDLAPPKPTRRFRNTRSAPACQKMVARTMGEASLAQLTGGRQSRTIRGCTPKRYKFSSKRLATPNSAGNRLRLSTTSRRAAMPWYSCPPAGANLCATRYRP
jgi:hypothetical protein